MNATEQIRLLREALQMQIDFGTIGVSEWAAKYPQAEKDSVFVLEKTIREAMSATATPPDDAPQAKTALPVYADTVESLRKERDDARLDRSAVLAQRDEALAKLAAAQKELAGIYAAKPEPEFSVWHPEDSEFYWIRRMERTISWEPIARCDKESVAIRIADALNGVKP